MADLSRVPSAKAVPLGSLAPALSLVPQEALFCGDAAARGTVLLAHSYAADMDEAEVDAEMTEAELVKLFQRLDRDHDEFLSRDEVAVGLGALGLPCSTEILDEIFVRPGQGRTKHVSAAEFKAYAAYKEAELQEAFVFIDRNQDGHIEPADLKSSLHHLHLKASDDQIDKIVRRMSRVPTSDVRFGEFRKFLLLLPGSSLRHVFDSWAKDSSVDLGLGEDFGVPDEVEGGKPAYLINFIAGGVAGAVSRTLTAPLDRLKVLMMTGNVSGQTVGQGLRSIYVEGGFVAFYRGNGSNVVKIIPESAMKFFTYEKLKNEIAEDPSNIAVHERFLAGAGAGITSQTLIYPLEIAKTRLAVAAKGEYRGIFHCLNRTIRYEGPRALYRGLGASLAGVAPYAGIDLMVFMTLKETWIRSHPHEVDGPGALTLLLFGATSSTIGATVAYPLQLIRTKLQAQGMNKSMPVVYNGPLDCFRKTLTQQGPRGLYRGLFPNLLKTLPAVATSYLVYEETRKALS